MRNWFLGIFFMVQCFGLFAQQKRVNFTTLDQFPGYPGKDLIGFYSKGSGYYFWTNSKIYRFNGWQFIEDKTLSKLIESVHLIPLSTIYLNKKGELLILGNNVQYNCTTKEKLPVPVLNGISTWASTPLGDGVLITGMRRCVFVDARGTYKILSNWRGNIIKAETSPNEAIIFSDTIKCIGAKGNVKWWKLNTNLGFSYFSLSYQPKDWMVGRFSFHGLPIYETMKSQLNGKNILLDTVNFKVNSFLNSLIKKDGTLISYGWYVGFIAQPDKAYFKHYLANHDLRGIYKDAKKRIVCCNIDQQLYLPKGDSAKICQDKAVIAATSFVDYKNNREILLMNPGNFFVKRNESFTKTPILNVCAFSYYQLNDSILICGGFDFYLLNINTLKVTYLPGFEDDAYIWSVRMWKGVLYVSYEDGLYTYDLKTYRIKKLISCRCRDLEFNDQNLFVATLDKGVLVLNEKGELIQAFNEKNRLSPNTVFSLLFTSDKNFLFLGCKGSLRVISLKTKVSKSFTEKDGLQIAEFNSGSSFFDSSTQTAYMGGINGLVSFVPSVMFKKFEEQNAFVPTFSFFSAISKLGKEYHYFDLREGLELDPDIRQMNLYVGCNPIGRFEKSDLSLWFSVSGENWVKNEPGDNLIRLMNLSKGDYPIKVKFLMPDGSFSQEKIFEIEILPYWYQSKVFIFFGILVALFLVFLATRFYFINKNEQVRSTVKTLQGELMLLRSQINPHFLNNLFELIAYQAIKNDIQSVVTTIHKVSGFFRSVLNLSSVTVHSLEDEVLWLINYLELQQQVTSYNIDFEFLIDENADIASVKIPALLIQPIIENSIKHGFLHGSVKGKVDIIIQQVDNCVAVYIVDNGVGKTNQNSLSTKVGLRNVQKRIEIFSKLSYNTIEVNAIPYEGKGFQTTLKFYL